MVSGPAKAIWIFVGVVATYVIVTKTNFLGDLVGYLQKKSPPMPTMMTMPVAPVVAPTPAPSAPVQPSTPPTPSVPASPIQSPSTSPPEPSAITGQLQPIKSKVGRTSNNLGNIGTQTQINPQIPQQVPGRGPTSSAPAPQLASNQHLFEFQNKVVEDGRDSFRINGNSTGVSSNQSYGIFTNPTTGTGGKGQYGYGVEITSGGPGSAEGKCCGITVGIKADTGKPFIATEDWTLPGKDHQGKHTYLCGGYQPGQAMVGDCQNTSGMSTFNIIGTTVPMSWHCDQKTSPGNVIYCGRLDNKHGCGPGYFAAIMNPMKNGQRILPNSINTGGQPANDPSRLRIDGLATPQMPVPVAVPE